ncbi:MAG TPA: glycosyltransferase family 4 protein [Chloroflexota bacterium]
MRREDHRASQGDIALSAREVVWVTLDFYPDDQASSQLFTDLLVRLAEHTKITVFCGYPVEATKGRPGPVPRRETYRGISIVRCGFNVAEKHGLLNRAILYAAFLAHAAWRLLWIDRRTLVFGVTSPAFIAHVLWLTSRLRRFRYGYMFLDVYPEALFALGRLKPTSPLARVWLPFNRLSYRAASLLAVLGRDMIPLLEQHYSIDPRRVMYIPHWSALELEHPVPVAANPLAKRLGIEDRFIVQYSGNMGLLHDIDAIVRAAEQLRDDPRIHFLLIGKGRRRQAAERLARDLGLTNITWMDFVPRECLDETLSCCHAALVSLRAGMEGVAVPSKLYGILALGRPVIAQVPRGSEIALVVEEERCGCLVEPGDTEGLACAIKSLASDAPLVAQMSAAAFSAYRLKYTLDHAVGAFRDLWASI